MTVDDSLIDVKRPELVEETESIPQSLRDVEGAVDVRLEEEPTIHRRGRVALSVTLVLLILLLLLACAALLALFRPAGTGSTNAGITWIRSIYYLNANIAGQAPNLRPSSVAINPDGQTFWVSDARHERLVRYDFNGVFKEIITQQVDGAPLIYPTDVAVGPDGTLYAAEETYNHVLIYDKDGKVTGQILIEHPTALAANKDMVVVGGRGGVAAYTLEGELLGVLGKIGMGEDNFDSVSGIAFDSDDNIYVVDTYNNRLSKYDSVGNRLWIVETGLPANRGYQGNKNLPQTEIQELWPAAMQLPTGVTIDAAGRVIVIDNLDFSIAAFDANDGAYIDKWGVFGYEDGFLYYPNDIDYDKQTDTFVLTEPMRGRAQIIRLPDSGGDWLAAARRSMGDLLRACCWPLLILLLILLIWAFFKWLSRRAREKQELEQAQDAMIDLKDGIIPEEESVLPRDDLSDSDG